MIMNQKVNVSVSKNWSTCFPVRCLMEKFLFATCRFLWSNRSGVYFYTSRFLKMRMDH
jgi:hypothetical protein